MSWHIDGLSAAHTVVQYDKVKKLAKEIPFEYHESEEKDYILILSVPGNQHAVVVDGDEDTLRDFAVRILDLFV